MINWDDIDRKNRQASAARAAEVARKTGTSTAERVGWTVFDIAENVIAGAGKGLEGIMDFGAGAVGWVGGIFDKDFQSDVRRFIETDYTGILYHDKLQELSRDSFTNDSKLGAFAENVANGFGQMLPTVLISAVTGGIAGAAGASATAAQAAANAASMSTLFASAAGNSTEEAMQDGASYGRAAAYGLVSGGIELATEKMWDSIGLFSSAKKGWLPEIKTSVASQGMRRVLLDTAKNAAEEGAEEMVSELANPLAKSIYMGKDALSDYGKAEYWKGVGEAGAVGAATATAFSGTIGKLRNRGIDSDISASMEKILELKESAAKMDALGTLDSEKNGMSARQQIENGIAGNIANVEKKLKSMDTEKRAKVIEKNRLSEMFDAEGNAKPEFLAQSGVSVSGVQSEGENGNGAGSVLDGQPRAYRSAIADDAAISQALSAGNVKAFTGEMSEEQKQGLSVVKNMLYNIGKKTGQNIQFVVADSSPANAYTSKSRGVVVIGADTLGKGGATTLAENLIINDTISGVVLHEGKHIGEDTESGLRLTDTLLRMANGENADEFIRTNLISRGYFTEESYDEFMESVKEGNADEEQVDLYTSEASAFLAQGAFSDSGFIGRLVRSETTIAEKILAKISDFKSAFGKNSAERKFFAKAERLYLDAIAEAGMTYRNGKIIGGKEDEEEEAVDNGENGEYNTKPEGIRYSGKVNTYISYTRIGKDNIEFIRNELRRLYAGVNNGIADGIAIEKGNTVYIVDSGKENGKLTFGVRKKKSIKNDELREKYLRGKNNDAISKGYVSNGLSEKFERGYGGGLGRDMRQESGNELRVNTEKSENYNGTDNESDRPRGRFRGGLKESAEVSKERILSDESDIRQSRKVETEDYTYDALTSKPDMEITVIKDGIQYTPSAQTRKNIVDRAIKNAASIGYTNENGNAVVHVKDMDSDVIVSRNGVQHGLDRRMNILAPVTVKVGEILQNAIRINEMNPRAENISDSYLLVGMAKNQRNVPYPVLFVVNRYNNEVESINTLYSLNAKKESARLNDAGVPTEVVRYLTDSNISISQLLDFVNRYFPDVLPEDVLRHYGRDVRPNGAFSQSVRFSKKVETEEKAVTDKEKIKELEKKVFFLGKQAKYSKEMAPTLRKLFDMAQSQVRDKVYYKQDAINAINSILGRSYDIGNGQRKIYTKLEEGKFEEAVGMLWAAMNTAEEGKRGEFVIDFANYLIRHTLAEDLFAEGSREIKFALDYVSVLDKYKKNIKLSQVRKSVEEILGNKSADIFEAKNGKGVSVTQAVKEIEKAFGRKIDGENSTQKFAELVKAYSSAKTIINKAFKTETQELLGEGNGVKTRRVMELRNQFVSELLNHFDMGGKPSKVAKTMMAFKSEISDLRSEIEEMRQEYRSKIETSNQEHRSKIEKMRQEQRSKIETINQEHRSKIEKMRQEQRSKIEENHSEIEAMRSEKEYTLQENREISERVKAEREVLDKAEKIKDWKKSKYISAAKYKLDIFDDTIGKLGEINNRGNLNESGTRKRIGKLLTWYNSREAKDFLGEDGYDRTIAEIMEDLANGKKVLSEEKREMLNEAALLYQKAGNLIPGTPQEACAEILKWYTRKNLGTEYKGYVKRALSDYHAANQFTVGDLKNISRVLDYFKHILENYGKVLINGKRVEALPYAQKFINIARKNKTYKRSMFNGNVMMGYTRIFGDPMTMARMTDYYQEGYYTVSMEWIRDAAVNTDIMKMEMREEMEAFLKKHRSIINDMEKKTMKVRGQEMSLGTAMALYMTLKRDQAKAGLIINGFKFKDADGKRLTAGSNEKYEEQMKSVGENDGEVEAFSKEDIDNWAEFESKWLYDQFSDEQREYIKLVEKIFNDCREVKKKTDLERSGYTNVIEGYYMPIERANKATGVGKHYQDDSVANFSFNKSTVKGAKGELLIRPLNEVFDNHVDYICKYANMTHVEDALSIIRNMDIGGNLNKPVTIETELAEQGLKHTDYLEKLLNDIRGTTSDNDVKEVKNLLGKIRGNFAQSVLAANPKVWITQLSSLFAATNIISYSSIIRGLFMKAGDVDEYCKLAKLRNNENAAALAQTVTEKMNRVGQILMAPIGKMDRFVVERLFAACQVEAETKHGLKIGTKENKIKAGEILQSVILETQQNALQSERSQAMRANSELAKTVTMFSADSMKSIGRCIDAAGEQFALKERLKTATGEERVALEKRLKEVNKQVGKSFSALLASAIFMALVAQGFKWLYRKDDEDEDVVENITLDAIGNMLGGLPLVKELYNGVVQGYELESHTFATMNELLTLAVTIKKEAADVIQRKATSQDLALLSRKAMNTFGRLFGVPIRNVYNVGYGLTKRFSPSTAYSIDNVFYKKKFVSDYTNAIENGDEKLAETIIGLAFGEGIDENVRNEIGKLTADGYTVLPRVIGNSVTVDGEEMKLTSAQKKKFQEIYYGAFDDIKKIIGTESYKAMTSEGKSKAILAAENIRYELAMSDLTGDTIGKSYLFEKAVGIDSLALVKAFSASTDSDKDKDGNTVAGSKKQKVKDFVQSLRLTAAQKYMLMGYLGYKNTAGEAAVKAYIQSLKMTVEQKKKLYAESGY